MKPKSALFILLVILAGCSRSQPIAPTDSMIEAPTSTPIEEPSSHVESNAGFRQVGFAVQRSCQKNDPCQINGESFPDGSELLLVPASGESQVSIYLPTGGDVVHIASPVDFDRPEEVFVMFREWETGQIQFIQNGEVIRSLNGQNIARISGADAQQVLALTYLPGTTDSGRAEIQVYPGVGAMVTAPGPEWLVVPFAIQGNGQSPPNNEYVAMWYTLEPYGIGGEIVFPPYSGLFYFLGNGELREELLPQEVQFSALSPDAKLAAYTRPPVSGIVIQDLETGVETPIPLSERSERGAGDAVFSPDSTKMAWMEAGGSLASGDFTSTIRIATTAGDLLAEFPAEILQQAAGYSNVIIRPVGWIDDERVLLQVFVTRDYGDKLLLIAHTDGSIEETIFTGTFIGLLFGE